MRKDRFRGALKSKTVIQLIKYTVDNKEHITTHNIDNMLKIHIKI